MRLKAETGRGWRIAGTWTPLAEESDAEEDEVWTGKTIESRE
jgi:hypothetical protein